jgi:plasmid stabilization system protein ParE
LKRLIWSHPARRDLFRIAAEAGELDPDLPLMLLGRVEEAPLALLEYPGIGSPIGHSGLRKWPVHKTPFILVYADRGETVEVRRVLHAASDWLGLFP